jgi:hypothetical protein
VNGTAAILRFNGFRVRVRLSHKYSSTATAIVLASLRIAG